MLGIGTTARRSVWRWASLGRGGDDAIERTADRRFGRVITARELDALGPLPEEIDWARERSRSDKHLFALALALKCLHRLGHFSRENRVAEVVLERVRSCLGVAGATMPDAARRTAVIIKSAALTRETRSARIPSRTRVGLVGVQAVSLGSCPQGQSESDRPARERLGARDPLLCATTSPSGAIAGAMSWLLRVVSGGVEAGAGRQRNCWFRVEAVTRQRRPSGGNPRAC